MRLPVLLLALMSASPASASLERERPSGRRPDGAGSVNVSVKVQRSELTLAQGAEFAGDLWYSPTGNGGYEGGVAMKARTRAGDVALPDLTFKLDAARNPFGAEETLGVPDLADAMLLRATSSSDFGLVPMRVIVPHIMEFDEDGGKAGTDEVSCSGGGSTVFLSSRKSDRLQIDGIWLETYFTRSVRYYQPSGYQIHDYVLTAEAEDEDFITAAYALRVLVHPTIQLGGRHPEGGVLLVLEIATNQRKWPGSGLRAPTSDLKRLRANFERDLCNALFDRMKDEGVGNPFDSPAAIALRDSQLLDERTAQRLVKANKDDAKSLAILGALLVDGRFSYEPDGHLKLWRKETDPARRLLLAAGAKAGGASDPEFARELKLALHSNDPVVLRAAACLAKALGDSAAEAEARRKAGS